MVRRARITVVCFTHVQRDARVLRQIRALAAHHDVTVVGYGSLDAGPGVSVYMRSVPRPASFVRRNVRAVPKLMLGRLVPRLGYDMCYWDREDHAQALEAIVESRPDVITGNDWISLPVAAVAAERCGAKIVLDLHEYAPLQRDNRRAWMALISPMIVHYLRRYGSQVGAFITVNRSLADRYRAEFGFSPAVVMNAPELHFTPTFRATAKDRIRLVHHGAAIPDRKIETMIEALALADTRYVLDFYFTAENQRHVRALQALAQKVAPGRVTFHDAVPPDHILATIAQYDMGIFVLEPTNFNYASALPNKFFEFVCAGLAVCIGPTPEMASIAREHGFAVVTDGFDAASVASALNALNASDVDALKRRAIVAAEALSAEHQMAVLLDVHARVLGG